MESNQCHVTIWKYRTEVNWEGLSYEYHQTWKLRRRIIEGILLRIGHASWTKK